MASWRRKRLSRHTNRCRQEASNTIVPLKCINDVKRFAVSGVRKSKTAYEAPNIAPKRCKRHQGCQTKRPKSIRRG
eukprot:4856232-Pyramimonas_sp.AAC.1